VTLHAHPDDEAIFTGGTIVRAVAAGWRVVLVVATDGGQGVHTGTAGDDLASRRRHETLAAAALLGIERVEFLGYGDSGCPAPADRRRPGTASARVVAAGTLAAAHLDGVVDQVRRILRDESATAITSYDDNGVYGHIDHVLVHQIAARSVHGTDVEHYESTLDRGALERLRADLVARGLVPGLWPPSLVGRLGLSPGPDLVALDVTVELPAKLAAVAAHASQTVEAGSFMGLPAGAFHHLLATEWFRVARPGPGRFLELVGPADAVTPGRRGSTGSRSRVAGPEPVAV
jgi:LmbE family N-acetylglucosaminyl deacetylase